MANSNGNLKKNVTKGVWILIGIVFVIMAGIFSVYLSASTVLLIVGGVLWFVFFFRRPFQGLLVFVFLLPSELLINATPGATILHYLGLGVVLIWLINLMVSRRPIIFRKRSLPYFFFFALSCLSLLWAPVPGLGFQFAITYLQLALLLLILLDQVSSLVRLKQVIIALAAGGILAIAIFLLFGGFGQSERFTPVSVGGPGLSTYVYPLAFSITILGILGILGKGRIRVFGVVAYIVGLYPVIGAGLRGALLAMGVGIGVAAVVVASKKRSAVIVTVLALALLIGAINYLGQAGILPPALIQHLTVANAVESRGTNRLDIWKIVLDVATTKPIFGLGLNQFGDFAYQHNLYDYAVGVHNDYLSTIVNLGGGGFIILITGELLTVFFLLKARKYVKDQDMVWYGVLVALIFASIVGQNFVDQIVFKYVWVIRAFVIAGSYPELWTGETKATQ
jgi:O-antigen ligase